VAPPKSLFFRQEILPWLCPSGIISRKGTMSSRIVELAIPFGRPLT
jgi:hypothetical protein